MEEVLDPRKVSVVCGQHNYAPGGTKPPTSGCKGCWFAYFIHEMAICPPDKREEKMESLEILVHHMSEAAEQGVTDFGLYPRPQIKITPEGEREDEFETERERKLVLPN